MTERSVYIVAFEAVVAVLLVSAMLMLNWTVLPNVNQAAETSKMTLEQSRDIRADTLNIADLVRHNEQKIRGITEALTEFVSAKSKDKNAERYLAAHRETQRLLREVLKRLDKK